MQKWGTGVGTSTTTQGAIQGPAAIIVAVLTIAACPVLKAAPPLAALRVEAPRRIEARIPGVTADRRAHPAEVRRWFQWLRGHGFAVDRCGVSVAEGVIHIDDVDAADLDRLGAEGFTDIRQLAEGPLQGALRTQSQYFDPDEIEAMLLTISQDHPAITHLFPIGATSGNRTIWALEISDAPCTPEDEPAIQFNGQHHAREVATSHIVMDVISFLTDGYGGDPDATAWVNQYKTVCVPMVNPDGVQYVFDVNSLWRKNRQSYPPSCVGVDLNRNYSYLWGPGCGSSPFCSNDIYRGPSAASELETQAMYALADQYHFVMATSYHSYGRFIDYPYACSDGSPSQQMPEHVVIHSMMLGVAAGIAAVDGVNYTVYSPVPFGGVNGDDTSWYYAHKGVYPFIIEVGTEFEPPFAQVAGIVNRNRGGWQYLYDRLGQARIDVHVTSNCIPIEADVTLANYAFDTGELPRTTFLPFGRWSFIVKPNGTSTVRASAPGFVTRDVIVAVNNAPVDVRIELVPVSPPALLLGDIDENCQVNAADIDDFVTALTTGGTPQEIQLGDFFQDCLLTADDIPGFVTAVLDGAACP
jgi:hypothetical protein